MPIRFLASQVHLTRIRGEHVMLPLSRPAVRAAAANRSSRPGRALRRACAVAAVALIPVLAGCEAGSNAPVLHWHPPTNGGSGAIHGGVGEIAIRNQVGLV